jgi:hypothetical protein
MMKFPVIVVPFLKPAGMALFPFVLVKSKVLLNDQVLIRHEEIHLRQQLELLVIPFYLLYLLNYLYNLAIYRVHERAYLQIIFEREAYRHEKERGYLTSRKLWAWINE